jgi:hypothetical protein
MGSFPDLVFRVINIVGGGDDSRATWIIYAAAVSQTGFLVHSEIILLAALNDQRMEGNNHNRTKKLRIASGRGFLCRVARWQNICSFRI